MTDAAEIKNSDQMNKAAEKQEKSPNPNILLTLKVGEYLLLAGSVGAGVVTYISPEVQIAKILLAVLTAGWIFMLLVNLRVLKRFRRVSLRYKINKNAELYNALVGSKKLIVNPSLNTARVNALEYCQELVEDYKSTRRNCRNIYYASQLATVVLSGITPILVLVDKLEAGVSWLKWLPVICPAIAAIVASIVTSFPFQKNWLAANATVELLEAEQEKFILGVSPLYSYYDTAEETQLSVKAQKAIENFIVQVNNIHLNQLQAMNDKNAEAQKQESAAAAASSQSSQPA